MNQQELKNVLDLHRKWILGESAGIRADLSYADLRSLNLSYVDLRYADLSHANFRYADLSFADLRYADLSSANLSFAYLSSADLSSAKLSSADLRFADLRYANLRFADLSYANLRSAKLRFADLRFADLRYADLRFANLSDTKLSFADLSYAELENIKEDYFEVLSVAKVEVPALYKSIVDGKINGSQYEGECACLVGTIANIRKESLEGLTIDLRPNALRLSEKWFMAISEGDTPDSNVVSKIVKEWTEDFMRKNEIVIPVREVIWK
jgi:uncharacterized protein YjbI with pentapeptide repeats